MRTNLLFHGVGQPRRALEQGEERVWISRGQLHTFLDIVTDVPATISVDDGNISDVEEVLPTLVQRGLVATFFVLAGRLDQPGSLSRSAVVELRDEGMRIGTHGMDHRSWRGLQPREEERELVVARQELSDLLGQAVEEAACPFGAYDRRALAQLRSHGYGRVHTSDGWPCRPDDWLQSRYSVGSHDDQRSVRAALLERPTVHHRVVQRAKAVWKRYR